MASTELVPMTKTELVAYLQGVDLGDATDTTESEYDLAIKILGAETLDKALEPDDVRKSETLVGTTFVVQSCSWRRSFQHDKAGRRYGFLTCVDADGVTFYTSMGGSQPVLLLTRLVRDDGLPAQLTFTETETGSGNTMTRLEIPSPDF